MVIVNKKFILVLLLTILFILCIVLIPLNTIKTVIAKANEYNSTQKTVIIDAGHGGVDPGAIGINNCKEKEINLNIALALRDILKVNGYETIMIRETDISLNDPKYKKIAQLKSDDLKKRLKLIEKSYKDKPNNTIAIMVHQNHFTQEKYNGAQMFYGKINPQSRPLAQALMQSFKDNLQPDNHREIKHSTSAVYVLHNASCPIVLAECGFISNSDEAELLCDDEYQKKIAFTIFCGIEKYMEGKESDK